METPKLWLGPSLPISLKPVELGSWGLGLQLSKLALLLVHTIDSLLLGTSQLFPCRLRIPKIPLMKLTGEPELSITESARGLCKVFWVLKMCDQKARCLTKRKNNAFLVPKVPDQGDLDEILKKRRGMG